MLDTKIRSPASAEADTFYCLEAPGSPRQYNITDSVLKGLLDFISPLFMKK